MFQTPEEPPGGKLKDSVVHPAYPASELEDLSLLTWDATVGVAGLGSNAAVETEIVVQIRD